MKVGDKLTVAGVEWTARPFTPAEHERFDEIAERYELERVAAEAHALAARRGGTAREAMLRADQKRLHAKLSAYLAEDGALREGLSEDERLAAFEVAAELDMLTERIEALRSERAIDAMLAEERLHAAREAVVIEFMHAVLGVPDPLDVFQASLTPLEVATLEEAVVLGKLRLGLSASTRRQSALLERALAQTPASSGGASGSPPQPPAAPRKRGRSGRSRKSSSASKGGA